MKKTLIVSVFTFLVLLLVCSCEDYEYPIIEVPETETENPSAADQTIPDLTRFIFIGESSEVIDGVNYTVRTYADANTDLPYRYVIYKAYYLNGVIRRVFTFNHTEGVCLDVPYTEFTEHMCGSGCSSTVSIYSEKGIILTQTVQTNTEKTVFGFYDNGKVSEKAVYNNNGMLIDEESYYEDGSFKKKHLVLYELAEVVIIYLPDGKRQKISYFYDGIGSESVEYEYHENGQIKKETSVDSDGSIRSITLYNSDGNILKKTQYYRSIENNVERIEEAITEYTYHENGVVKSKTEYRDGELRSNSTYNDKGELIKEVSLYTGSETITEYTYHENGQRKSEIKYDSNHVKTYEYTYTSDGKTDEYKYYRSGVMTSYSKCIYKDNGTFYRFTEEYTNNGKLSHQSLYKNYDELIYNYFDSNEERTSYGENYVNNNSSTPKLRIDFLNEDIKSFTYYYPSGYVKYYYISNILYIFDDNVTRYADSYSASSTINPYLEEQALSLLEDLVYDLSDLGFEM